MFSKSLYSAVNHFGMEAGYDIDQLDAAIVVEFAAGSLVLEKEDPDDFVDGVIPGGGVGVS